MNYHVYLSRRNLLILLSKLDRASTSNTACSIIKSDNTHPKYPQDMSSLVVTAVENYDGYSNILPIVVYISRNDLNSLLMKLDVAKKNNGASDAYIKMKGIKIYAIEDDEYYAHREAGRMHHIDEARIAINEEV